MPSARDHHGDGRPSRGRNGLVVAQPRKSGETKGAGGDGRSQDVETGNTKAPLLDKRRRRQHVGNYAGCGGFGQASLQRKLLPGFAGKGDESSFWGQGGLLSSRRVRLLLLLVFLVKVRTHGRL